MGTVVIALGGNALQEAGAAATAENQLTMARKTAGYIADIAGSGWRVAVAHGNGPQVGRIVLQNEHAGAVTPAMPFDVCGAMSQGMIGYHIQLSLQEALRARGLPGHVVTLVTQVVVDADDPMFSNPTKPIGPFYDEARAVEIAAEKGYVMKEDAGRGWRRVVASPLPVEIVEINAVRALLAQGFIPIAAGGGGIPVVRNGDGSLSGVAAVIDKDLAAALLAEDIDADTLLILTAVDRVYLNYGKPGQTGLSVLSLADAARYMGEGQFASGSMLPKVQAAVRFAASQQGRKAIIASLEDAARALAGLAGTAIVRDV